MKFQLPIRLERMGLIFMFCAYCDVRMSPFEVGAEIARPRLDKVLMMPYCFQNRFISTLSFAYSLSVRKEQSVYGVIRFAPFTLPMQAKPSD